MSGEDEGDFERRSERRRTGGRTSSAVATAGGEKRGTESGRASLLLHAAPLASSAGFPSPSFRPAAVGLLSEEKSESWCGGGGAKSTATSERETEAV